MKIGFFITARLKSSRLKQKIILPLNGNNVIDHVINSCKAVNGIEDVVLCTSTNPQDSELYQYALKHNVKFYIGSENDVLQRLLDAAKYYGFDAFLSITADNPLHSIYISNLIVDWAKKKPLDFIFTSGLPIGLAPYFLSTKALEVAIAMKQNSDTEIWGPFVNRPDFFNIGYLNFKTSLFPEKLRLTCDYLEDYMFINSVYNQFPKNHIPSIFEIAQLIQDNKISLTNSSVEQLYPSEASLNSIKRTFDNNIEIGKKKAKEINFNLESGQDELTIEL